MSNFNLTNSLKNMAVILVNISHADATPIFITSDLNSQTVYCSNVEGDFKYNFEAWNPNVITIFENNEDFYRKSLNSILKSGFEWLVIMDYPLELKFDFFLKLRDDIREHFIALRNIGFAIIGHNLDSEFGWSYTMNTYHTRYLYLSFDEYKNFIPNNHSPICLHRSILEYVLRYYTINNNVDLIKSIRSLCFVIFDKFLLSRSKSSSNLGINLDKI